MYEIDREQEKRERIMHERFQKDKIANNNEYENIDFEKRNFNIWLLKNEKSTKTESIYGKYLACV